MVVLGGMGSSTAPDCGSRYHLFKHPAAKSVVGKPCSAEEYCLRVDLIVIVIFSNAPAMKRFRESLNLKKRLRKKSSRPVDVSKIRNDEAKWDRIETKIKMEEILSVDTRTTYADDPVPPEADVVPLQTTQDNGRQQEEEKKGDE